VAGGREVSGSLPLAVASVDQPLYRRGATVTARVDITDPDNRVVIMSADGTGPAGEAMHLDQRVTYSDIPHVLWRYRGTTATLGTGLTLSLLAPARTVVLEAVVTDAQGHEVVASVPVTVQSLRVGVDVQGATYTLDTLDAAYATWPAFTGPSKLFWKATAGLPTWDGKTAHVPMGAVPQLCFKDYPTQAQWLALLDGVPADRSEVWLTWNQEGDRTTTPEAFTSGWLKLIGWAVGHPNRARVRLVPDLTWYWERYHDADQYARFIVAGADCLGVDIYPGGQTSWTDPAECLRAPLAAARAAGVPLVIPEAGVVVPANPTLTQMHARADWWDGLLAAADAAGDVLGLGVWQADGDQTVGTGGFVFNSSDPARAVVSSWMTGGAA